MTSLRSSPHTLRNPPNQRMHRSGKTRLGSLRSATSTSHPVIQNVRLPLFRNLNRLFGCPIIRPIDDTALDVPRSHALFRERGLTGKLPPNWRSAPPGIPNDFRDARSGLDRPHSRARALGSQRPSPSLLNLLAVKRRVAGSIPLRGGAWAESDITTTGKPPMTTPTPPGGPSSPPPGRCTDVCQVVPAEMRKVGGGLRNSYRVVTMGETWSGLRPGEGDLGTSR